MGGKREETDRDVGAMHGREAREKCGTLSFLMTFGPFFSKLTKISKEY